MQRRNRRAKIVATVGPASASPTMLRRLFLAGVDVFRLNFSHGVHEDHAAVHKAIRDLEADVGRPIGILQDLQGPKIRVGTLKDGAIVVKTGETVRFVPEGRDGDAQSIPLPHPEIFAAALPGHRLLTAVDQKPKSGRRLARLDNIEADARVAVLADHYDDDWSRLWWVRADGIAAVTAERPPEAALLEDRYPAYRTDPPHGPWIEIDVRALAGWSAT